MSSSALVEKICVWSIFSFASLLESWGSKSPGKKWSKQDAATSERISAAAAKSCLTRVTPQRAAYQAPLSLGFSRQEYESGLPFPSPMNESEKWKWSRSAVLTPSDPMDCSLPGSSVYGIFQARVQKWGAIAFSKSLDSLNYFKWALTMRGSVLIQETPES